MVMVFNKRHLQADTYQAFIAECQALVKKFEGLPEASPDCEDANSYGFAFYLYPSYTYDQSEE